MDCAMVNDTQGFRDHPTPPAFVVNNVSADDVAGAIIRNGLQKEPFYLFDMDETYLHVQRFRTKMPRIHIFYAMKSNDSEMLLKMAVALGLGFDCASPGEINRILNFNVDPTSIIYAAPSKTSEQMIYAKLSGVKHATFDTSYELIKLKQYWPEAKLLIRIKVDSDSVYKLAEKFGCDFETEAVRLLEEAGSLDLNVIGVAFHVGSVCYSRESYLVGLRQARALFDHEQRAGRGMKILDIGGGFFDETTEKFDQLSSSINQSLAQLFPEPDVQVIAEPGRYICESAFKLYCNINNVQRILRNNIPLNIIHINDGVNGTLTCIESWQKVFKFGNLTNNEDELEDTIVWGPTSDPKDRVARVPLPRCSLSDWLLFTMQGAYTMTFSTRFGGHEIPLIRPVISSYLWKQIKDNAVFAPGDFVVNPDISTPLPSTLPPVIPEDCCLRTRFI